MASRIASIAVGLLLALGSAAGSAFAKPPAAAFTPIPEIHDMVLSPDGKRVAWVQNSGSGDGVVERNLETNEIKPLIRADGRQMLGLRYLTDRYIHFIAYKIKYDVDDKDVYRLGTPHIFDRERETSYRLDGYGRFLAVSADQKHVFMLARGNVIDIVLETGNVWSDDLGRLGEDDFVIDHSGKLIAAQDVDRETGENTIFAASGTDRRAVFKESAKPSEVHLVGLMPDEKFVAVEDRRDGGRVLRSLALADGALSDPLFGASAPEVLGAFRDTSGAIVGAAMAGLYPRFEFFDADMTTDARSLRASFPGQAVRLINWDDAKTKVLAYVEGGIEPGRYVIFDRKTRKVTTVAQARPAISREDMGEVVTIEYAARDGRKISAIVTWPARVSADQRKNLPLVVLPHDNPDSYSAVTFDWIAQFLANEGYAVLQPNYRGSGGFGVAFRQAGFDRFGREMQHDITDGVHALSKMGWIDADRVCIAGRGWGGYLALMGGAITPTRYRCVAAVGAVTDIPDFLKKRTEGDQRYNDYVGRWKALLGETDANWENQQRYSPVNLARQFAAPVLLIHGDNDLFSPDRQSRKMEMALQADDKPVTYILLPRENEALLQPESQQRVLSELSKFFAVNMTPKPQASKP